MESLNLPAISLKSQVSAVALQYKNVFKKIKTDTGPHPHPPLYSHAKGGQSPGEEMVDNIPQVDKIGAN